MEEKAGKRRRRFSRHQTNISPCYDHEGASLPRLILFHWEAAMSATEGRQSRKLCFEQHFSYIPLIPTRPSTPPHVKKVINRHRIIPNQYFTLLHSFLGVCLSSPPPPPSSPPTTLTVHSSFSSLLYFLIRFPHQRNYHLLILNESPNTLHGFNTAF